MRLMVVIALVINVFLALSLVFFQATRKTYPGFGLWTTGVSLLGLGYLSLCLRGYVPDSVSILVVNGAFPLGMVLQLAAMRRFLGLTPMPLLWYAVPGGAVAAAAVFYYGYDSVGWRTLIVSTALSAPHFAMAFLILRYPVRPRSMFYGVIGSLLALGGAMILSRGIWSLYEPQFHIFLDSPVQLIFFVSVVVVQLGETLAFMMLNSERVESELVEAEAELRKTVDGLQKALAEQKRVEESLRDSEERYRTFFDTSRDCVFMTTVDGRFTDFNDVALEMLGYSLSDRSVMMSKDVALFYANPEEREAHSKRVATVGFSKDFPVDFRKKDGTIIHALVTTVARKDPQGNIIGFQGTVRDITERKRAEEELRQGREMLSLALDGANLGMWDWDLTTGKALWSERNHQMLGYEPNEFEPNLKNWKKIVHPDDWLKVSNNLNLHIEGKLPFFEVEYRTLAKSRDWHWVQAQGKVVGFGADGKPSRMTGVIADITERKRAEEALRNSEAKYRFLTEHASDLIWTLDLNLRTTFVTPSVEKVLGFTAEERMLQRVEDQLTPESLEFARQKLFEELSIEQEQGIQEGKSVLVELDYYHKDGSIVCLQTAVAFIRDEKGMPVGLHGISRDVTELKRVQEDLRESEEKYRTVVEESFDGVFVHDGTVITFANSRLHEMLGYEPGELEGVNHWVIYHPDFQEVTRSRAQARLRGESVLPRYEVNLLRKDGTSFPGEVNAKVILFDKEPQIQVWIRDLTEQKRLERGLVEAQKMEAIGTLTGGIAHDFNNLLTIILGYSEMLLVDRDEKDPAYDDLQKIMQSARNGAEMVQRLLVFSRKAEKNPVPLDLNRQVRNTERLLIRTLPKMIRIEMRLADDLGPVHADPAQMDQIVMNLAINAKEAMPGGGILTLETSNVTLESEFCARYPGVAPGDYVLLSVSDTGHGMDKKIQDRMFDPFFTVRGWGSRKGTGLGLPVVLGIVQQHGGCIECLSEVGKGTTFNIYLPKFSAEPLSDQADSRDVPALGTETILLVDDEVLVRELGERILTKSGYRVLTARNGREALDIYKQHQPDIALVILDLIMPEMSGYDCLRELVKIDPQVRVIVSSGQSDSEDLHEVPHEFVLGSVKKPYLMRQFLETVRSALDA